MMPSFGRGVKRIDANQKIIQQDLAPYKSWLSVKDTHGTGGGFGDMVVGVADLNFIFEVKNPLTNSRLTEAEAELHSNWCGDIAVVMTTRDVVNHLLAKVHPGHPHYQFIQNLYRKLTR